MIRTQLTSILLTLISIAYVVPAYGQHGKEMGMSLDEFFEYVNILGAHISPDGGSVIISTRRSDWQQNRYRLDLWIVRNGAAPALLTESGHDGDPEWSPDGHWIAFLSSRAQGNAASHNGAEQLYIISTDGNEAFPVTHSEESVHAFAWSADSRSLYFATREPQLKSERAKYEAKWKDVVQYREANRGDRISCVEIAKAIALAESMAPSVRQDKSPEIGTRTSEEEPNKPEDGSITLAHTPLVVDDMTVSHDGRTLAFTTGPASHRHEGMKEYEIFLLATSSGQLRQLTSNEASESSPRWSPDDKKLFFTTYGDPVGKYQHVQERIYAIDIKPDEIERWGSTFPGAVGGTYQITSSGTLVTTAVSGVETQIYGLTSPVDELTKFAGTAGSYSSFSLATRSPKVAFIYSAWGKPAEVYLAEDLEHLREARPITKFNERFTKYELPIGKTYEWRGDDGARIEGVLLYPPGKFGAKHLPTLTLIHGGPANTDGNRFRADWYDWAVLAAMRGYLVFRPNYRGSAGYGDAFLQQISPHIVSLPGRDILMGLDALVKDGIADPHKLSIAGYSYGGFLTNWLITQTSRFKAAMTGAGAVEHVMQWGNDDLPFGDVWYLKGMPWQAETNYNEEAAIFQMDKVTTPTHIVGGSLDIRVYIGEQFLLERSLHMLDVPSKLLLFPGEGHLLTNNPWHGKIKVREELLWLTKYCPREDVPTASKPKE